MNRKGIDPLVATLLLIAIAVAVSVSTFWWAMNMMGSSQSYQYTSMINVKEIQPMQNSNSYLLMLSNGTLRVFCMSDSVVEKIVLNKDIQISWSFSSGNKWIVNVEK